MNVPVAMLMNRLKFTVGKIKWWNVYTTLGYLFCLEITERKFEIHLGTLTSSYIFLGLGIVDDRRFLRIVATAEAFKPANAENTLCELPPPPSNMFANSCNTGMFQ